MKVDKVFKRYDIRGVYPDEIDERFCERMGKSFGKFASKKNNSKVVICRDTKTSSEGLKNSFIEGLTNQGLKVIDIGVGTTDMASYYCKRFSSIGVQITSSHMPLEFNGMKFLYPKGNGFVNEDLNTVKSIFRDNEFETKEAVAGKTVEDSEERYVSDLVEYVDKQFGFLDEERTVVVETMGGSASVVAERIFEKAGFNFVEIDDSSTPYRDPPNPDPGNLDHLADRVDSENAYMGLAFDLDADRVAAYYDGEWISGDDLFCIFAQLVEGDIVASVDTDSKIEGFCDKVFYTRVGDPFVIDATIEHGVELSGEPNGHYCFPSFTCYNSGVLAGLVLARSDLDSLLGNIPKTSVCEDSIVFEDRNTAEISMDKFIDRVKADYKVISEVDGIKFSLDDVNVLVRLSGSSPKIRVKVFGDAETELSQYVDRIFSLLDDE